MSVTQQGEQSKEFEELIHDQRCKLPLKVYSIASRLFDLVSFPPLLKRDDVCASLIGQPSQVHTPVDGHSAHSTKSFIDILLDLNHQSTLSNSQILECSYRAVPLCNYNSL